MCRVVRWSRLAGAARVVAVGAAVALVIASCSTSSKSTSTPAAGSGASAKVLNVVASINAWGSIAEQLGGTHARVTSIIANPDTDPHDYEPTPADARSIARAQVVVVNGIGYDGWADKLIAANPVAGRTEIDVGKLVNVPDGGNPHRWYNPADVNAVIGQITTAYKTADPANASYFDTQERAFRTQGLTKYTRTITEIGRKYRGTPVGASESIFSMMAPALGLDLITPPSFLKAISEGTDVSASDKATIDEQIASKAIKVYVFNSQNSTPDVAAQVAAAKKRGIAVSAVTETLSPQGASFQDWQTAQLTAMQAALKQATGR